MTGIVYTTTLTKPMPEIALANALNELTAVVPRREVVAQAFSEQAPESGDEGRALSFKLTDEGYEIFKTGIVGSPKGWKDWPASAPEPDFSRYPL